MNIISKITNFAWLAPVALASLVFALMYRRKYAPRPGYLQTDEPRFPLNLFNTIHRWLSLLGVRLFKVDNKGLVKMAEECVALDADKKLFGDQGDLVLAVDLFTKNIRQDICTAAGMLLFNQYLAQCLRRRKEVTNYFLVHPDLKDHKLSKILIITGLPRTGSTMLYNLMDCDPSSRAPRFFEMAHLSTSTPPATSRDAREKDPRIQNCLQRFDEVEHYYPNFWTESSKSHRSHPNEIEEDLLVMMHQFVHQVHVAITLDDNNKSAYRTWYEDPNKDAVYAYHRRFMDMMDHAWTPDSHWVLKAPVHATYFDSLIKAYPEAKIVITHRDPNKVVPSWANLLESYLGYFCQNGALNRERYGHYILESLVLQGKRILEYKQKADPKQYFDCVYSEMIKDPIGMVQKIYHFFDLGDLSQEFIDNMKAWIKENRQNKWGRRHYSLGDYNITENDVDKAFAEYNNVYLPPDARGV